MASLLVSLGGSGAPSDVYDDAGWKMVHWKSLGVVVLLPSFLSPIRSGHHLNLLNENTLVEGDASETLPSLPCAC